MFTVGLIGCGHWGPNLLRNFMYHSHFRVLWVCDQVAERRESIELSYPGILTGSCVEELLELYPVDILSVATPAYTHFDIVKLGLERGCHIFVEKPLTLNVEQNLELINLAYWKKRVLFVDFTYLYHSAIRFIKDKIFSGLLGNKLLSYTSERANWGIVRRDVNAIVDLAIHDFSILRYLFDIPVLSIEATGIAHIPGEPLNQACVTCYCERDFIANIYVNWFAPYKKRQILFSGDERILEYDELEPSHLLSVYERRLPSADNFDDMSFLTGEQGVEKLKYPSSEPLHMAIEEFYRHVNTGILALENNMLSLEVGAMLECANESVSRHQGAVILPNLDLLRKKYAYNQR